MRIFQGFDSLDRLPAPVVTMGSYDGVHAGHRALLARTVEIARERGGESVVVTFSPHPRVALGRADGLKLLSSTEEKAALLAECGIDNMIVAPFTREFAALPHERFLREYLVGKIGMKAFVVGYDHRFGRGKEGGYDSLEAMCSELGFDVVRISEQDMGDVAVSSTLIRSLIERGDMQGAALMLGKPYAVTGSWDGVSLRSPEPLKLLPPAGEYSVTIETPEGCAAGRATVTPDGRMVVYMPAAECITVRFDRH